MPRKGMKVSDSRLYTTPWSSGCSCQAVLRLQATLPVSNPRSKTFARARPGGAGQAVLARRCEAGQLPVTYPALSHDGNPSAA